MSFFVKIVLMCVACLAVFASVFAGTREDEVIEKVNAIIACIESGTPLTEGQRRFLFPEVPLEEFPYFWELNRKDRRVQRLRKLIEQSTDLSTREKEIFFSRTSGDAERSAYEDLSIGGMVLPILLPQEDWSDEFKKYGLSWHRQKEAVEELVRVLPDYERALKNPENTKTLETARILYIKALQNVLTLSRPKSSEEHRRACVYFYEEVWPLVRGVRKKEMDILSNNREFIFLIRRTNESLCGVSDKGSYLMEYTILEEIRERITKRKAREKP